MPDPTATAMASVAAKRASSISTKLHSACRCGSVNMYGSSHRIPAAARCDCTASPAARHVFSSATTNARLSGNCSANIDGTRSSMSVPISRATVSVAAAKASAIRLLLFINGLFRFESKYN